MSASKWVTREGAKTDRVASGKSFDAQGADIDGELGVCPEAAGLLAMAEGFHASVPDDHEKLRLQFPVYDALYAYCRNLVERAG